MAETDFTRPTEPAARGAAESFLSLLGSFSAYLQARLELAGWEGRDAGLRLLAFAILLGLAALLLVGSYVFAVILLFLLLQAWLGWSTIAMTALFLLVHLVAALLALLLAKSRLKAPFFPHSIAQLAEDRAWLKRQQPAETPKP